MEKIEFEDTLFHRAIACLNDSDAYHLFDILRLGDLSFSQLKNLSNYNKSKLSNKLNKSTDSGLIENYYQKKVGKNEYSFYRATLYGLNLANNFEQMKKSVKGIETVSIKKIREQHEIMGEDKFDKLKTIDTIDRLVNFLNADGINRILKKPKSYTSPRNFDNQFRKMAIESKLIDDFFFYSSRSSGGFIGEFVDWIDKDTNLSTKNKIKNLLG